MTPLSRALRLSSSMALAVSAAELLYRVLDMPNGYWVPMTVLLILRPAARETAALALARLGGTLCGVGLLTLLMALLRPAVPVLVGLIAVTAWICYAFLRVNYAILSLTITMYVVLLFAIACAAAIVGSAASGIGMRASACTTAASIGRASGRVVLVHTYWPADAWHVCGDGHTLLLGSHGAPCSMVGE